MFQQIAASGHFIRAWRVTGQCGQHTRQDFPALVIETVDLRTGLEK
jgi:hypothetical protein